MSRTFKDRRDNAATPKPAQHRQSRDHMGAVLRFSMGRYVRANMRGDVDRSAKWFAAVDRSSRILGALD